jgi:hypothetical protein
LAVQYSRRDFLRLREVRAELICLRRDIEKIDSDIAALKKSGGVVKASDAAFPYVLHCTAVEGVPVSGAPLIKRLTAKRAEHAAAHEKYVAEYARIERLIADVDDVQMRRILSARYIEGLRYHQIATRLGADIGEDAVRMKIKRFFGEEKKK